jgi:histone acetyltransferase (RNA polymerase elongator complex component)
MCAFHDHAHYTTHTQQAIELLKNNCYKIDVHLMPNLPGSSPSLDRHMFDTMLADPRLQVDQV